LAAWRHTITPLGEAPKRLRLRLGFFLCLLILACGCRSPGTLFQRPLRLLDAPQSSLSPRQLGGQFIPPPVPSVCGVFLRIGSFGTLQQTAHFLTQPLLFLFDPPVTHRLVFAGVGLQLAAVDRHPPQLHRPHLQRQPQYLLD
jgi:hypothetical protein